MYWKVYLERFGVERDQLGGSFTLKIYPCESDHPNGTSKLTSNKKNNLVTQNFQYRLEKKNLTYREKYRKGNMDFKNKEDVKFRTLCIRVKQTTQVTTIPEMG